MWGLFSGFAGKQPPLSLCHGKPKRTIIHWGRFGMTGLMIHMSFLVLISYFGCFSLRRQGNCDPWIIGDNLYNFRSF